MISPDVFASSFTRAGNSAISRGGPVQGPYPSPTPTPTRNTRRRRDDYTLSRSLSPSRSLSLTLSLALSHPLSLSHPLARSLSPSRALSHQRRRDNQPDAGLRDQSACAGFWVKNITPDAGTPNPDTHSHPLALSRSLSLSHTHTHTHTHTHPLALSLSHTLQQPTRDAGAMINLTLAFETKVPVPALRVGVTD